jgi:Cellulase (glycosyl hydrolase family 5)
MKRRSFCLTSLASGASVHPSSAIQLNAEINTRIGVNCFDLFYGLLVDPQRTRNPDVRLLELHKNKIPLVRFSSSPFWPREWAMYKNDKAKYFKAMDSVFDAAERRQVMLVPSLFWNPSSVSDLVNEPISAWGKEGSKTRAFMSQYTEDVVSRYKGNSSILMWEFGNEFNSYADLPNALRWWPKVDEAMGTPSRRTSLDLIKASDCASTFAFFASVVKQFDQQRLVGSGADIPNFNAQNLIQGSFTADTKQQFRSALKTLTPNGVEVMSVHLYPQREGKYFSSTSSNFSSLLNEVMASAHSASKRVFVGEFGVVRSSNQEMERQTFTRLLDAIVASRVDWAALWVYDLWTQEKDWTVRFDNDRAWQLDLIAQANRHN